MRTSRGTRLAIGIGGTVLAVAPFLPWAEAANGTDPSGWDVSAGVAALTVLTGLIAIATAVTGGAVGLFRPDVSFRGAADIFSVVTSVVVGCVLLFDIDGAAYGAVIALAAAILVAMVCGDYRVFRGAPAFPRLTDDR